MVATVSPRHTLGADERHSHAVLLIGTELAKRCLQCTPAWETQWWQKRADKRQYTCSACAKQLPRTAYSAEGFANQKAMVCISGASEAEWCALQRGHCLVCAVGVGKNEEESLPFNDM